MKPLATIHAAESGRLREILVERNRSFVVIYGESGVGKTTLIDCVLQELSLSRHTLRYEIADSKDTLKGYLNSIFSQYHSASGIIQRILGIHLQVSAARLGIGIPMSISVKRSARGVTVELGGRRDRTQLVLKGAAYRLNGSTPPSFFRRLWALLRSQGIRILWVANAELLPESEVSLLAGMCQFVSENSHVLVEVGGIGRRLEKRRAAIEFSTQSCPIAAGPIRLKNLNFAEARQFHEAVSVAMPVPAFDYAKNCGNPLSIIYDISFAHRKYAVSRTISKLTRSKAKRDTLLLLAGLFGVIHDSETLFAVASDAGLNLDLKDFIEAGIVDHVGARLSLSHPMFSDFVLSEFRTTFRPLLRKIAPALRKHNRGAYLYLLLRFAKTFGVPITDDNWSLLASTLIAAITEYEFADLTNLLPWISTLDGVPPNVQYVADFVTVQYGVYNYEYNSSRIAGYMAPVETIAKMLLEVQSHYHKNCFADAIAMASSPSMTEAVANLRNAEQERWAISVLEALMGVCRIALGQHDRARESLAAARQLASTTTSRGQYLLLLDNFLYGEGYYKTHQPVPRALVPNNYIRAKLNHNIYASKICHDFMGAGLPEEYGENVITPFLAIDSQEVTYSYVNLGAMLIARGELGRAIDLLEQTKLRVFEIYDAISCLNNLIVAHALNGHLVEAESNYHEFLATLKETRFDDPSFLVKPKLNMAIIARRMARHNYADELLMTCNLPEDHINWPILEYKRRQLATPPADIRELPGTAGNDIFRRMTYWVQILEFWDYNAPIIDAEFFGFTEMPRSVRAARRETNFEKPR
jgi:hypothetical protein